MDHIPSAEGFSLAHLRYLVIDEADRVIEMAETGWLKAFVGRFTTPAELSESFNVVAPQPLKPLLMHKLLRQPDWRRSLVLRLMAQAGKVVGRVRETPVPLYELRQYEATYLSALAAVLGACSALAGPGPAAEVAPVVVWAQAAVGGPSDSADTDFRSRFGLFADQSDGDQLSFDQTPTPGDQTPTPSERNQQAEAEQRSDAGGEPGGQDQGPADGRASDAEEGSASAGHSARLALLRQRRKKLRLSAARDPARLSVIRRRQKPAAAEKSEEPATDSTSDQQGTEAKDSATEAPRLRRPFGLRRRRPVHSPSHQRRRRPSQQATTETSATPARRPSRRRRPIQPPTSTARPTEEPAATQPADAGSEETVYYKPSAEEYPDYPPFAPPREPTQAPQPPLQAPQLASPGSRDTAQAAQEPSSDSLQQFSDQPGPPNGGKSDNEQNLTDKVTKLKQKLAEEKEQNENELSSEDVPKPVVPSLPAEQFGQRLPARPGSGLPGSAHPRRPSSSEGPLADLLTRRRDQQVPGQLLLQRG
ncbi:hypothetical protein FJT64_019577 [Amphibalanus amphitrite]|uniref:ATP-dependent RNA helicase DDX51 n=1 Tax=Amphibalanus amphitrite TaxID=1232801 RepID=A0A6A4X4M3_AMPAM|nr:hypothetical protein FJT64_019577 [Amphibalanus amphitrite]